MMQNGDIYIYVGDYYLKLKDGNRDVALGPVVNHDEYDAKARGYPISTLKWSEGGSASKCKVVFNLLDVLKEVEKNVSNSDM